jgi:hypothetical protein
MRAVGSFARRHIIGVTALFLALGGTSYAVTGDVAKKSDTKTLYACVTAKYHTLNLSSKGAKCPPGARKISFDVQGPKGAAGAPGVKGDAGPAGPAGANGAPGEAGPAGASTTVFGSPGAKGTTGETGPQGPKGDTGDTGPQGVTGLTGDVGPVGPKGDTGAQGPQGDKGDKGDKGDIGLSGGAGAKGDKGDTGTAGATGAKGDKGDPGATGAKGDKGDPGATGAKGDKGDPGATGAKGDPGAKGDKGDPGATGATGPAGPSGGGVKLVDGNNVVLGTVIAGDRDSATVVTSAGYQVDVPFSGVLRPAQIYYTAANCGGTAYLNDGGSGGTISDKWVVYSGSQNTLMVPATTSGGVSTSESFTGATIDNPACGPSAGAHSGWKLKSITRTAAGLPSTFALPLTLK